MEEITVGTICLGRDIDRTNSGSRYQRYIRVRCPNCEKERWIRLARGTLGLAYCQSCRARLLWSDPEFKKRMITLRAGTYLTGNKSHFWNDGRSRTAQGYVRIRLKPDDFYFPMAGKDRFVLEHRLVMAKYLNRCLLPWEIVHHKNGIKDDNRLENLQLLSTNKYHIVDTVTKNLIARLQKQISLLEDENEELRAYQRKGI